MADVLSTPIAKSELTPRAAAAIVAAVGATSMLDVRRRRGGADRGLWVLYGGNLALNLAWTLIFFRGRSPLAASVEIVALEATTVALIVRVRPISPLAALALVPYALWVVFATALTWATHGAQRLTRHLTRHQHPSAPGRLGHVRAAASR
jgi:tryptophan-rich sensory protein